MGDHQCVPGLRAVDRWHADAQLSDHSIAENVEYITDQRNLLQDIISVEIARRERHQVESEKLGNKISIALAQQSEIQKASLVQFHRN
ncbi:hypothetical protein [Mesorhizobium sp.]|uniref:hypothetical protein n=1 Tax=Mesorhizobium sp. TaxID=1871066 RepID=UPI000FE4131A|nr:hypothetical protein [Mesorhizobium sp.]RWN92552.1 MAG: hypothetical protein EOS06_32510 [Mesorhizobium sp.]TJU73269.1 MAG: hypothetical protein E5Y15_32965 [Mesorhizobium sp.]